METPVVASTIQDIATSLDHGWVDYQNTKPWKLHEYVYASGGSPCNRKMVYEMTAGDQKAAWTPEQLANFQRGKDREENIKADMREIGRRSRPRYELIRDQERFEIKDSKGRVCIVGKVEGFINFDNGISVPYEIKSWSQNISSRIDSFEDLMLSPWTRAASTQILSYLYASKSPYGLLILDRHGLPRHVTIELEPNREAIEQFIKQAESAVDHVKAETLPDFIADPGECKRCSFFGGICQPDTKRDAAKILTDPELEATLVKREELKEAHSEYEALDKIAKAQLKGIETGLCGQFLIQGKAGHRKAYSVKEADTWTIKIEKI